MPLSPLQIEQLNAASARVAAGTGSDIDRRNIAYATERHGYSYAPPAAPGAPTAALDPSLAARGGINYGDFLDLNVLGQDDFDVSGRRVALRERYRIPELEQGAFRREPKSYTEIFNEAYAQAGLGELKTKIADLDAKIKARRDDVVKAEGQISDNPWISEASRVGRVNKLYETAQKEISNLIDERNALSGEYQTGLDLAERTANQTLSAFDRSRQLSQQELNYYAGLAEEELKGETEADKRKRTRQALRYLPDYLKAKVEAGEVEAPKTIETAQGILMWDRKQGRYVPTGYSPYRAPSSPTQSDENRATRANMAARLQEVAGGDGFVAPGDYRRAKAMWVQNGLTSQDFDNSFSSFIDPSHAEDYLTGG